MNIGKYATAALASVCVVSASDAGPAETNAPLVELTIVAGAEHADLVAERVLSWFPAAHGKITTARRAVLDPDSVLSSRGPAGVQIWITLADATVAQVFFTVRERKNSVPRYLVADVPLASGLDELGIEQLAQVVYPSTVALWAGNVESSRTDVEQELRHQRGDTLATSPPLFLQPPPTARESRSAWAYSLGAEYGVALTGAGVAQRIGAQASVGRGPAKWRLGARLHLAALLPRSAVASGVELELDGAATALGASVTNQRGVASVIGELGAGIELVRYRTGMLADPTLVPTQGGWSPQPLFYARAGLAFAVGSGTLGIDATLGIHLMRTHYDVISGGHAMELIEPWLLQPGLAARVAW